MSDSLLQPRLQAHRPLARDLGAFLRRGNVADLAIGVVIGAAFGKIVSSLVADIVTPPLGLLIDEVNFSALRFCIGGTAAAPVTVNYGMFLQTLLDFAIIGVALFGLSRLINWFRRGDPAPLTKDQELLAEIRDLLRTNGDTTVESPFTHSRS